MSKKLHTFGTQTVSFTWQRLMENLMISLIVNKSINKCFNNHSPHPNTTRKPQTFLLSLSFFSLTVSLMIYKTNYYLFMYTQIHQTQLERKLLCYLFALLKEFTTSIVYAIFISRLAHNFFLPFHSVSYSIWTWTEWRKLKEMCWSIRENEQRKSLRRTHILRIRKFRPSPVLSSRKYYVMWLCVWVRTTKSSWWYILSFMTTTCKKRNTKNYDYIFDSGRWKSVWMSATM